MAKGRYSTVEVEVECEDEHCEDVDGFANCPLLAKPGHEGMLVAVQRGLAEQHHSPTTLELDVALARHDPSSVVRAAPGTDDVIMVLSADAARRLLLVEEAQAS